MTLLQGCSVELSNVSAIQIHMEHCCESVILSQHYFRQEYAGNRRKTAWDGVYSITIVYHSQVTSNMKLDRFHWPGVRFLVHVDRVTMLGASLCAAVSGDVADAPSRLQGVMAPVSQVQRNRGGRGVCLTTWVLAVKSTSIDHRAVSSHEHRN
jgi:hypothetical protein